MNRTELPPADGGIVIRVETLIDGTITEEDRATIRQMETAYIAGILAYMATVGHPMTSINKESKGKADK